MSSFSNGGYVALSKPPPTRLCLFGLSARRPAFWTSTSLSALMRHLPFPTPKFNLTICLGKI